MESITLKDQTITLKSMDEAGYKLSAFGAPDCVDLGFDLEGKNMFGPPSCDLFAEIYHECEEEPSDDTTAAPDMPAEQEAERQRIDAEGKATANRILSASLTDRILQEKGIEASLKLSESPNSKVIVIGSGDGGLPIILGNN